MMFCNLVALTFFLQISFFVLALPGQGQAIDSSLQLTTEEQNFLQQPIHYNILFPTETQDELLNQAAKFLNDIQETKDLDNYDELLKAILNKDTELVSGTPPIVPGAFIDASASLFSTADIQPTDFPQLSLSDQTAEVIKAKEELLTFAKILLKEAKKAGLPPVKVDESVTKLKETLKNNPVQKVYVYSSDPNDVIAYEALRTEYPEITIIFRLLPSDFASFADEIAYITDGLVFIVRIPNTYPAIYAPDWFPIYDRFAARGPADFIISTYPVLPYFSTYYQKHYHTPDWREWKHRRFKRDRDRPTYARIHPNKPFHEARLQRRRERLAEEKASIQQRKAGDSEISRLRVKPDRAQPSIRQEQRQRRKEGLKSAQRAQRAQRAQTIEKQKPKKVEQTKKVKPQQQQTLKRQERRQEKQQRAVKRQRKQAQKQIKKAQKQSVKVEKQQRKGKKKSQT
ncbi:MAG TPA: hypothetical protein VNJ29_03525 [Candidatus Nitrosotenuis sp.]|nr:hypothetical protein [Candidatus Nitrosotenuis sp.]